MVFFEKMIPANKLTPHEQFSALEGKNSLSKIAFTHTVGKNPGLMEILFLNDQFLSVIYPKEMVINNHLGI